MTKELDEKIREEALAYADIEEIRTIFHPVSLTQTNFPNHERRLWRHGIIIGYIESGTKSKAMAEYWVRKGFEAGRKIYDRDGPFEGWKFESVDDFLAEVFGEIGK